jgi:predicted DCC family thiol-disulfide oxidoreductase YuxK
VGKRFLESFGRIDARSLGLFRIAMALVLIGDLFRRWIWLRVFYSNDGLLPNHNHIFNLRDKTPVWSLLHAFSTPGEGHFAFALILLVYVGFLVGYKTRVFHALSLLSLVSLGSRNILLENQGNFAATALLFFTLFLPLGSRYSIDECVATIDSQDEKTAADLNARKSSTDAEINAARSPGWSPLSFAALAITLQIALILISSALWHRTDTWKVGHALHQALYVERWASDLGAAMRTAPAGLLKGLSYLLLAIEWAVPALIFIPVARRVTRGLATGLLVVYALVLGLFFSLGLYAWTLLAAAMLLLPKETWDVFEGISEAKQSAAKQRTVIYDVDCGICLWIARMCKRLDKRGLLIFQGNDDLEQLNRRQADGSIERVDLPAAVTAELVQTSVVVVDAQGNAFTKARAIAEIVRVFPFGSPVAFLMRLPGIAQILNVFYDAFASRRTRVSELCGLNACGIPLPKEAEEETKDAPTLTEVPSAVRALRFLTGFVREAAVVVLFVAALAQMTKENPLPFKLPQGPKLLAIVSWPRLLGKWNVLDVPSEDGVFIVDGQTRKNTNIDPLTGLEPVTTAEAFNARRLGQLWNDYLGRVRLREYEPFQRAFRDYLTKGGPALEGKPTDEALTGYDGYWVRYSIATPGQTPMRTITGREKVFVHSRGGRSGMDRIPLIKTDALRRPE